MNIFLAGATGIIGRQLLPRLTEAGHTVSAITRSPDRAFQLRAAGTQPVVCDIFDGDDSVLNTPGIEALVLR
jgi:uncharacterized protein YbjT (DUF2867 family)